MPSRDYVINYDAKSARAAAADIDALIAKVTQLDQSLDRVAPKLRAFGSGASRGFTTTATAAGKLTSGLNAVEASAKKAGTALADAAAQGKGAGKAMETTTESTNAAGTSLERFVGYGLALSAVRQVFSTVMSESRDLEAYWQKLASEAGDFRESLKELASLRNQKGPNNDVTADVLDLALAARLSADKASELSSSYENIGPTVREKGHYKPTQGTPEELEKSILAEAGRTANRLGVDPGAAGEAIGTAGMFHTFTSTEDAMQQLGGALKGLSEGKVKYTQGVRALSKGAAMLVDPEAASGEGAKAGKISSFAEAGIYMGALSLGTGTADQAQNRMVQISRLLNPDADNETGTKALRSAGLTDEMSDPDKLVRLSESLKEKGVKDPLAWLAANKLGTVSTREKTVAALKIADSLKLRLAAHRAGLAGNAAGKETIAANREFMATDQASAANAVDAATDVVGKTLGIEGPEVFEKAKQAAETRLTLTDPYHNSRGTAVGAALFSPLSYLQYGVGVRGYEQEHGALKTLRQSAGRVGVDLSGFEGDKGFDSGDLKTRADAFTKASRMVRAKGGDPLGVDELNTLAKRRLDATREGPGAGNAADPNVAKLVDQGDKQLQELKRLNDRLGPGPAPARPAAAALPAGGGDFNPGRK